MSKSKPFFFPIRFKMAASSISLILLISVFILYYYPLQYKRQAIDSIESQVNTVAELMALGIGAAFYSSDIIALSEVLGRSRGDSSLVFIALYDPDSQVIAQYDPTDRSYALPALISNSELKETENALWINYPIVFRSQDLGTLYMVYDLSDVYEQVADQRWATLLICVIMIAAGTGIAYLLSTKITSRIRELKDATYNIVDGDSSLKINFEPTDEVGALGVDFQKMVDRLNESHKKLVEHSRDLEATNKELNQFSYVTSHDLKAPLRSLSSLIAFIRTELNGQMTDTVVEYFGLMESRISRMENLIEGILEYSRVGRKNTTRANVDLNEILNDVLDFLAPPDHFDIKIHNELPKVFANKVRMQQVFQNLIGNAIKYCDKEEIKVEVGCDKTDDYYMFSVKDNGVGIESAYYDKVFEVFQTLNPRDEVEASGIGLSITKKIIEDLGGKIWLNSEYGVGSTFYFTMPIIYKS